MGLGEPPPLSLRDWASTDMDLAGSGERDIRRCRDDRGSIDMADAYSAGACTSSCRLPHWCMDTPVAAAAPRYRCHIPHISMHIKLQHLLLISARQPANR